METWRSLVAPSGPLAHHDPTAGSSARFRGRTVAWSSLAAAALVLAATMPVRLATVPVLGGFSLLDAVLLVLGSALAVEALLAGRLDAGDTRVLALLAVPIGAALLSVTWSVDLTLTLRATLVYLQAALAYLVVVRIVRGWSADRLWAWIRAFTYLLVLPAALLWLRVPGFAPHEQGLQPDTTEYVGYYSRLSHPVLGRSNNLASVLAFFVVLLGARAIVVRNRRDGWAAAIGVGAVLLTFSRGVIVSLVVAGALLAVSGAVHPGRFLQRIVVAAGIALAALLVVFQLNPTIGEFFGGRLDPATAAEDRRQLLDRAIETTLDRPAVGLGAGVSPLALDGSQEDVHNTYVQQLVYFGVPLGLVVVTALLTLLVHLWTLRTTTARIVACAVAGQLVVFLVESSFEGAVLRVIFGLSVGLGVALSRATPDRLVGSRG